MKWRVGIVAFVIALALGAAAGLAYSWMPAPGQVSQVAPDSLAFPDRMVYLEMVGDLYAAERDLARARERLTQLGVDPDGAALVDLLEQQLDSGAPLDEMRTLARLARDLGAGGGVLGVFALPTPGPAAVGMETPTALPGPSELVTATLAPAVRPAAGFQLVEQTASCGRAGQPGVIAVRVRDAAGKGLPGVEVSVSWAAGEDRFYTGLRPERGPGYADFQMSPGMEYEVSLAGLPSERARGLLADLSPGICPTASLSLDWQVVFQQIP